MNRLPVIVSCGGYNAAGRSSGNLAYRRMIYESLSSSQQRQTLTALAGLMSIDAEVGNESLQARVLEGTLVRKIESDVIPPQLMKFGHRVQLNQVSDAVTPISLRLSAKDVPNPLPAGWRIAQDLGTKVEVEIVSGVDALVEVPQTLPVQSAGQLPQGFNPGAHYRSIHHPRGLQLAVMGASDAVNSLGIQWKDIVRHVRPDEIAVYSSSVMSQLDENGFGGLMLGRTRGRRVSSKQLPLGLNTMPADFINAYVLGSVGVTGGVTGACATFLYNLRAGIEDIKSGRRRVVMVGSSEAPIVPEVIDGYSAMSALATDEDLRKLDGTSDVDYRRASRPFGENCGFTLAESSQYVILMDDTLALELGAPILGSVPGVYVNADGYKKSISAPGPGNYITLASAVAQARELLGDGAIQTRSFVQAHGSSTPHNRVSESLILDKIADVFGIKDWPVAAIKSYVGHSLGPASGDQLGASLGTFEHGILPGIKTISSVASDVHSKRLSISNRDQELGCENALIAFLNSKGFGGNNATATILAPSVTRSMLTQRHGQKVWQRYHELHEGVQTAIGEYYASAARGKLNAIYRFGEGLIDEEAVAIDTDQVQIPGFPNALKLKGGEGFEDLVLKR